MYNSIILSDSITKLTLIPDLGGAIGSWQSLKDGLDLLRPLSTLTSDTTARQLGAFLLMPWSNRIANGGIDTPAGWVALPNTPNQQFAMHGTTWYESWEVLEHTKDTAVLSYKTLTPIAFQAIQHIRLENGTLYLQVEVTHLDERPFWHGYGWHPFFPRTPNTQLQMHLTQMWQNSEQGLSLYEKKLPKELDFSNAKKLPDGLFDHAFSGWDGQYTIVQSDKGYRLQVSTTGMPYLILYTPLHQQFFCVEPVSHPINAHHLATRPGLKLLNQNQTLSFNIKATYLSVS